MLLMISKKVGPVNIPTSSELRVPFPYMGCFCDMCQFYWDEITSYWPDLGFPDKRRRAIFSNMFWISVFLLGISFIPLFLPFLIMVFFWGGGVCSTLIVFYIPWTPAFIHWVVCKCSLPVCGIPFHSGHCFLCGAVKGLNWPKSHLAIFVSVFSYVFLHVIY